MVVFLPGWEKGCRNNRWLSGSEETIYLADIDGSSIFHLVKLHIGDGPVWSPDGTKLAFPYQAHGYKLPQ